MAAMRMAALRILLCAACTVGAQTGYHAPFAIGPGMATLGAIIDEHDASGRQPWAPAAFLGRTAGFGVTVAGGSFYSPLDDERGLLLGGAGGWISSGRLGVKTGITHFSAWQVYTEQTFSASCGIRLIRRIAVSVELTGKRTSCIVSPLSRYGGTVGVCGWIPWSWAAISLQGEHLLQSDEGFVPTARWHGGIHTAHHRLGGQGVIVTVSPSENRPICFTFAEAYRLVPSVLLQAALSNNPLLVAVGVSFALGSTGFGVALVNHPVLGWSQGVWGEWYSRTEKRSITH